MKMNSLMTFLKIINKRNRFGLTMLSIPQEQNYKMSTNSSTWEVTKEKDTFKEVLPGIIDMLTTRSKFSNSPEVAAWMKKVLQYNLKDGKVTRGLSTIFAYETLEKPEYITESALEISRVLGWCVEMFHASFLVTDDIMDGSTKRRGVLCWYRLPRVGLGAINDSMLIYSCIYEVLKAYCGNLVQYRYIEDLFIEATLYTSMGQYLDYTMAHRHKNDYSLFTMDRYDSIVKYKTAYYTYKLPICLGLLLTNNTDAETHRITEEICFNIGYLYQIQDDFIDCFGAENVTGKTGNDIQEGKCSWLAVQTLQQCSPEQRRVFVECYGSSEPTHVERIKKLYEELKLPSIYQREEKLRYDSVVQRAQQLPVESSMSDLFLKLLDMIYDRKK